MAGRAEKRGVVLGIESWLSAPDHIRILDAVGSPYVQVYYDLANSTQMGYDVLAEIRLLGGKRICEFHAKENGYLLGQGRINFPAVRTAVDEIGYSGWLQIEGAVPKAELHEVASGSTFDKLSPAKYAKYTTALLVACGAVSFEHDAIAAFHVC